MKKLKNILTRRLTWIAIVVLCAVIVVAQKILYYSADPVGEKECAPLLPETTDTTKDTTITAALPVSLPWIQQGGTINDASCLNKTSIYGAVQVTTIEDIQNALRFAKDNQRKVSIAGVKHSMGGQAFARQALVLDMTKFNQMSLNKEQRLLTVQSGATWHDIQNFLHPEFAVKAMQSTDIFTVGGSISVNAHGMDHQAGAVSKTIRSLRVMLPDGSIERVSRTQNPRLFNHVVGGYGLFGIILDAEIEVTTNAIYQTERRLINYKEFPDVFKNDIGPNNKYGLFYGHLSTAPQSLLREMILYTYAEVDGTGANIQPLTEVSSVKLRRLVLNLSKHGSLAKRLKWFVEKRLEPKLESCTVSRNQALTDGEACFVSRNEPMHDSVPYLRNNLKNDTDILHEYFIPREQFIPFVDGLRTILETNEANLLNASVRVVHREEAALNYAPTDAFSIVLYINQTTDQEGNERMQKITQELIDLSTTVGGKFFLPYQLHYTQEQLELAYPEIPAFFAAKRNYDPNGLLTNTFYEKYSQDTAQP